MVSSCFLITIRQMIDKASLKSFIERELEGGPLFLVDVNVTPTNEITVEVDSDGSVDIDRCVELSRAIEGAFDREVEDYELEVGSAGLTSPFKVLRQYEKYKGREVEVLSGGRKYKGLLREVGPEGFMITCSEKFKPEGSKRSEVREVEHRFAYSDVKYTKYLLQF